MKGLRNTYNLAFFLGPGLPLTLGGALGSRAAVEVLLTPLFLMTSVGGGIDEALGVPTGAGVLEFDSDGLSPFELVAPCDGSAAVAAVSFGGVSSLISVGTGPKGRKASGDSFMVTSRLGFDDFRRAVGVIAVLVDAAIVRLWMGGEAATGRRLSFCPGRLATHRR